MKQAFIRLLSISFLAIIGLVLAILGLRMMGLKRLYAPLDHPIVKMDFIIVAMGGGKEEYPAHSRVAFDHALKASPNTILQIDLRPTKDHKWVLLAEDDLSLQTDGTGLVSEKTFDEIKSLDVGFHFQNEAGEYPYRGKGLKILSVEDFFEFYPNTPVLLTVHSRFPQEVDALLKLVDQKARAENIVFQAVDSNIYRNVRNMRPQWQFVSTSNMVDEARLMTGLFVETIANLRFDWLLTDAKGKGPHALPERLVKEVKRRSLKIIVEGEDPCSVEPDFVKATYDGLLTTRPTFTAKQLSGCPRGQ